MARSIEESVWASKSSSIAESLLARAEWEESIAASLEVAAQEAESVYSALEESRAEVRRASIEASIAESLAAESRAEAARQASLAEASRQAAEAARQASLAEASRQAAEASRRAAEAAAKTTAAPPAPSGGGDAVIIGDSRSEGIAVYGAWPAVRFVFCSVGPCKGETYGATTVAAFNAEIHRFNEEMKTLCDASYLDSGEYLERTGFNSGDGIHYDKATYERWYHYVLEQAQ